MTKQQELDIAYQRKLQGSATPTDIRNLDYGQKTGIWQPSRTLDSGSLKGTLPPEQTTNSPIDSSPIQGASLADFKGLLKNVTRIAYAQGPTASDILSQYSSAGVPLTTPSVIGEALKSELTSRAGQIGDVYKNTLDLIQEQQAQRQNYMKTVLDRVDFMPTAKEYQELLDNNPSEELLTKIQKSETRKQGKEKKTEITEVGGRKLLIDSTTGEMIKDLGVSPRSGGIGEGAGGGISSMEIPIMKTTERNENFLAQLPPKTANLVKQIADYKIDISKVTSLRSNERQKMAEMVANYDPSFDMSQYGARVALRKDFTSGKAAQQIKSLNTVVGHLDTLKKVSNNLSNSSVQLWNKITNLGLTQVGDSRVTNFLTAANAVESELATVFKGQGATDQEIKAWRQSLNSSMSPQQLKDSISSMIELIGSRLQALTSQYEVGFGKPKDFKILTDKSRKILTNLGADVDSLDPTQEQVNIPQIQRQPLSSFINSISEFIR